MMRTDERKQFLTDVLVTAIENCGYGWFVVHEYKWDVPLGEAYAVIQAEDGDETTYRVDLDTLAHGVDVIRGARLDLVMEGPVRSAWFNEAGMRLHVSDWQRTSILAADRTNGDEGDIDVVGARHPGVRAIR